MRKDYFRDYFNYLKGLPFSYRHSYFPWYDDTADYNTNAKSYYDYLARNNKILSVLTDFVNRLMNRDLKVTDTNSIDLEIIGNWIDNGDCPPDNYDDIITLLANVIISPETMEKTFNNEIYNLSNAIEELKSGIFSPDYLPILNALQDSINTILSDLQQLNTKVNNLETIVDNLETRLDGVETNINNIETILDEYMTNFDRLYDSFAKIVQNLQESGFITNIYGDDPYFDFNGHIAYGNINFFSEQPDGDKFIRTNKTGTTGDITAGYPEGGY